MMRNIVLLLTICSIVHASTSTRGPLVSTPPDISLCEGDDLFLRWKFTEEAKDIVRESYVFLFYNEDGKVGEWAPGDDIKGVNQFEGRAQRIPGSVAGVVIRNVTKADSGVYIIDTLVPYKFYDDVNVAVYSDSDIKPKVSVNNVIVTGDAFEGINLDIFTLAVQTHEDIMANISISLEAHEYSHVCSEQSMCTLKVDMTNASMIIDIHMHAALEICHTYTYHRVVKISTQTGVRYLNSKVFTQGPDVGLRPLFTKDTLTLSWKTSLKDEEILWCFWYYQRRGYWEKFLGFDNSKKKKVPTATLR